MNNTGNFSEMKRCKTDWLDDIFYGTKESKGTRNMIKLAKQYGLKTYIIER